jgi:hypothetical protein
MEVQVEVHNGHVYLLILALIVIFGFLLRYALTPSDSEKQRIKLKAQFDAEVAQAKTRSSIPPLDAARVAKIFKKPSDTQFTREPRDDEPTGQFVRPPVK